MNKTIRIFWDEVKEDFEFSTDRNKDDSQSLREFLNDWQYDDGYLSSWVQENPLFSCFWGDGICNVLANELINKLTNEFLKSSEFENLTDDIEIFMNVWEEFFDKNIQRQAVKILRKQLNNQ